MKKILGWPLVYICYHLGDWFYKLGNIVPYNPRYDKIFQPIYSWISFKPYQYFMMKSFNIDNWAGLDFWKKEIE